MSPHTTPNPPTMADVAAAAGVSHQTVSRVINNFNGVRPATRQRVEDAIRALGYRRNHAARALVTQRSGLIGVIAVGSFLYGPTNTLATIEKSARSHGHLTLLATVEEADEDLFRAALDEFLDHSVEAVVVIAAQEPLVRYSSSLSLDIPLLIVGPRPDNLGSLPCMGVDQKAGARLAVEHLVDLGHTDLALVSGPRHWVEAQQRMDSALLACEEHGVHPRVFSGDWSPEAGYRVGQSLASIPADRRPTGVVMANDHMALGMIAALREHHIELPGEISVVGFDDVPEAGYYSPALTTVHQDFRSLGGRVIDALHALLQGDEPDLSPMVPTLTVRASTQPPRS